MAEKKLNVLTIFGTRKELIKLYPVLEKLQASDHIESIIATTHQHQEEFEDLYDLFNISTDHDLNLQRAENYLSDITNLALSGIEPLLKLHRPDLVLMDIQLPGMDGLSATKIVKEDPSLKDIPIVALTSYAMQGDKEKALGAGCAGYIAKPIDTRKFLETVSQFIKDDNSQGESCRYEI